MSVSVEPLQCPSCGAAVPFGAEPTARCAYCAALVPVPGAYVAVQRSAQRFLADRATAQELYGELGRPPGWLLRTWGRGAEASSRIGSRVGMALLGLIWVHPGVGVGAVLAAAFLMGYPASLLIRGGYWALGQPLTEPLSAYAPLGLGAVLVCALVGFPAVWFGRERALAPVRFDVHASLAAALPSRPGGPARCWSCGAALDVPQGALGVPCAYCRADNLVALPATWVERVRRAEHQHFKSIDAALQAYREAQAAARERLWKLVFGLIVVFPVVMLGAQVLDLLKITF